MPVGSGVNGRPDLQRVHRPVCWGPLLRSGSAWAADQSVQGVREPPVCPASPQVLVVGVGVGFQQRSGIAWIVVSAWAMADAQGQEAGSRRCRRRPLCTRRPGTVKTRRCRVLAVAFSRSGPPKRPTARARLWAITAQCQPGGVGHELPRGQVRQAGALELGDPLLDDRVPAVVGLDLGDVAGAVGDERVVVPGGEQRQLAAGGGADPAHHQPHGEGVLAGERRVAGLGDVGTGDLRGREPVRDRRPGSSPMASIAARIFLSCRAVTENSTPSLTAVPSTARL